MTINFTGRVDEREEIVENEHGFNFQLFLQDNEYEELLSRTSIGNNYNDIDYLIHETNVTIDATANLYEDKVVSILIVIQDDLNGWKDDEIMISGKEEVSLLQDMNRAAEKDGFGELVNLIHEALSDRTEQKGIDSCTMTQTETLHENSLQTTETTFDFYDTEISVHELADKIEQYMYERGEYDFPEDNTIIWIEKDSRETTAMNIAIAIEEDIFSLDNYFDDELTEIDENDELLTVALEIKENLKETAKERYGVILSDRPADEQKKSDMERD